MRMARYAGRGVYRVFHDITATATHDDEVMLKYQHDIITITSNIAFF